MGLSRDENDAIEILRPYYLARIEAGHTGRDAITLALEDVRHFALEMGTIATVRAARVTDLLAANVYYAICLGEADRKKRQLQEDCTAAYGKRITD